MQGVTGPGEPLVVGGDEPPVVELPSLAGTEVSDDETAELARSLTDPAVTPAEPHPARAALAAMAASAR